MAIREVTRGVRTFMGTSSDTKPTTGIKTGDRFYEINTDTWFTYNGSAWVEDADDSISASLGASDVEIGAVELKDAATDTRAKIGAGSGLATGDNAVAVADPTLMGRIGEVQASPTANTVLDRLKAIATALAGTLTVALPTGAATAANQTAGNTSLDAIEESVLVMVVLSTDAKPTTRPDTSALEAGDAVLEYDTDAVYRWNGSAWVISGTALRVVKTATIADDGSLSASVDLQGYRVAAIDLPSTWDAAAMTFQGSNDNSAFANLYDDAGTEITIASAALSASRSLIPGTALALQLMAHRYLKVRSGTSGSPVNQTTGTTRAISLVCLPL
jgi:hypothetical protein